MLKDNIFINEQNALFICILLIVFRRGRPYRMVRVIDLEPLAPHRCGLDSRKGHWGHLSCEEANQLTYRTPVVLLRCPFEPEIMHEGAPEVFSPCERLKVAI